MAYTMACVANSTHGQNVVLQKRETFLGKRQNKILCMGQSGKVKTNARGFMVYIYSHGTLGKEALHYLVAAAGRLGVYHENKIMHNHSVISSQ